LCRVSTEVLRQFSRGKSQRSGCRRHRRCSARDWYAAGFLARLTVKTGAVRWFERPATDLCRDRSEDSTVTHDAVRANTRKRGDVEIQRFNNGWLFKWYGMTYEGGKTDVEDFRGGRITYAGIRFGHQQQQVFWQAIDRYLDQKRFMKHSSSGSLKPAHCRMKSG
jgi:hypothetical protein